MGGILKDNLGEGKCESKIAARQRVFAARHQRALWAGPPNFLGGENHWYDDFAYFSQKSYGPGGPKKIEKMPSSRYEYEDSISQI